MEEGALGGAAARDGARVELAVLARMLWREGFDDRISGHITLRSGDEMLCTPYGLGWGELTSSDILRIDMSGSILDGRWPVNPAIALHRAIHEFRSDVAVAVHHHPQWATRWAAACRKPGIYDQFSAFAADDLTLYTAYEGGVDDPALARANVEAMGSSNSILLAHHGVLVLASSMAEAHLRCVVLEHRCRMAWHVEALGAKSEVDPVVASTVAAQFDGAGTGWPELYEAMQRREIQSDPRVLL